MKDRAAYWIATCFGAGKLPVAPGTFGTVCALPVIILLKDHSAVLLGVLGAFLIVGVWASSATARHLGEEDPPCVVIDEFCGMIVSILFLPHHWLLLLAAFFGFRLFDIVKPPPIRLVERWQGGFGVMMDDVVAGVYVNLILQIVVAYVRV